MYIKTNPNKEAWAVALDLKEDEMFEASFNLIGFFETLYRIDERLKAEAGKGQACD